MRQVEDGYANERLRADKCGHCKYSESCYGITDSKTREDCKSCVTDGGRAYVREAPRWSEMSYYHV